LIKNGYRVRGTVRSLKNKDQYNHLYEIPNANNLLELVEADLLKENSFDDAVKGVDAVFHTASPFFYGAKDPQKELVDPALNGTRNVFSAVVKNGVKRVVVTSSVAAVYHPGESKSPSYVYTESDWNTLSSLDNLPYPYSKVLAEREAWKLAGENNINLTTVNPPFIFGPVVAKDRVKSVEDLNASNAFLRGFLTASSSDKISATAGLSAVHARDVAKAHRLALENDSTIGQRLICSALKFSRAQLTLLLADLYPQYKDHIPSDIEYTDDVTTIEQGVERAHSFSSNNLLKLTPFGEFISLKDMVKETVDSMIELNLL
jgi:nucleoside-diphosphate-sugar epimerase